MSHHELKKIAFFCIAIATASGLTACHGADESASHVMAPHVVDNGGDLVVLGFRENEKEVLAALRENQFSSQSVLKNLAVEKYVALQLTVVSSADLTSNGNDVDAVYNSSTHQIAVHRTRWLNLDKRGQRLVTAHQILLILGVADQDGSAAFELVRNIENKRFVTDSRPLASAAKEIQSQFYASGTSKTISEGDLNLKSYWSCRQISADGHKNDFFLRFFHFGGGVYTISEREGFNANGSWSSATAERMRAPLGDASDKAKVTSEGIELAVQGDGDIGKELYRRTADGSIVFETSTIARSPDAQRTSKVYANQLIRFYGICTPFDGMEDQR